MKALRLTGFGSSYPHKKPLLHDLDWELDEGSFALLTGKTGSGKTTLLRCLKPELMPAGKQAGQAEVFGRPPASFDVSESACSIGYVFQSPENQVVCDTVWQELAFGLENLGLEQQSLRRRVAEVAQFFGIEAWMERSTASLSGGQQQILNLASILVMQPKLLLLDEPTAQLDPIAEKNFLHALFRINRELGITVVVATHTPEPMLEYAQACFRLHQGKIEAINFVAIDHSTAASHAGDNTGVLPCSSQNKMVEPLRKRLFGVKQKTQAARVELRDLWFRYERDDDFVLRGADLSIGQGHIHAIVGGNGSGKTTILKLIAGIVKPERGSVGNDFVKHQALLPQNPKALFIGDTVIEELREWQKQVGYSDAEIARLAFRLRLTEQLSHHPYDTSGGQQQKIALAKLLLTKPDLLLLDEPTKGLDPQEKEEMTALFDKLSDEGKTLVIVTHDLDLVSRVADTVSLLFNGEIVCMEEAQQFFRNNMFYRPHKRIAFSENRDTGSAG